MTETVEELRASPLFSVLFDIEQVQVSERFTAQVGSNVRAAMKNAVPRVLQADVAEWLELSQGAVWHRLEGHTPWTIGELVVVIDRLDLPIEDLLAGVSELAA